MNKTIKSIGQEVLHVNPILRKIYVRKRFSQEIKLLNQKHIAQTDHQSILFFTLHKCASMYVSKLLKEILKSTNITFIDLSTYLNFVGQSIYALDESLKEKTSRAFNPKGYFYTAIRDPRILEIVKNQEKFKILLLLRDPRNVLTSAYFSLGYTHKLPINELKREEFLDWRNVVSNQEVDDYLVKVKQYWLNNYTYYCQNLLGKPNVLFVKYEDMTNNFDNWLNTVVQFLEANVSQKKLDKVINKARKNKVESVDYKQKLKPETIDLLNLEFREVLNMLGY